MVHKNLFVLSALICGTIAAPQYDSLSAVMAEGQGLNGPAIANPFPAANASSTAPPAAPGLQTTQGTVQSVAPTAGPANPQAAAQAPSSVAAAPPASSQTSPESSAQIQAAAAQNAPAAQQPAQQPAQQLAQQPAQQPAAAAPAASTRPVTVQSSAAVAPAAQQPADGGVNGGVGQGPVQTSQAAAAPQVADQGVDGGVDVDSTSTTQAVAPRPSRQALSWNTASGGGQDDSDVNAPSGGVDQGSQGSGNVQPAEPAATQQATPNQAAAAGSAQQASQGGESSGPGQTTQNGPASPAQRQSSCELQQLTSSDPDLFPGDVGEQPDWALHVSIYNKAMPEKGATLGQRLFNAIGQMCASSIQNVTAVPLQYDASHSLVAFNVSMLLQNTISGTPCVQQAIFSAENQHVNCTEVVATSAEGP